MTLQQKSAHKQIIQMLAEQAGLSCQHETNSPSIQLDITCHMEAISLLLFRRKKQLFQETSKCSIGTGIRISTTFMLER